MITTFLLSNKGLEEDILWAVCVITVLGIALIIWLSRKERKEQSSYEEAILDILYTFFKPQIDRIIDKYTSNWDWKYYSNVDSLWFIEWGEEEKILWEFHCSVRTGIGYFVINASEIGEKALYRTNGESLELVREESFDFNEYMMIKIGFEMHNENYLDKYNNLEKMIPSDCSKHYYMCKHQKFVQECLQNRNRSF